MSASKISLGQQRGTKRKASTATSPTATRSTKSSRPVKDVKTLDDVKDEEYLDDEVFNALCASPKQEGVPDSTDDSDNDDGNVEDGNVDDDNVDDDNVDDGNVDDGTATNVSSRKSVGGKAPRIASRRTLARHEQQAIPVPTLAEQLRYAHNNVRRIEEEMRALENELCFARHTVCRIEEGLPDHR